MNTESAKSVKVEPIFSTLLQLLAEENTKGENHSHRLDRLMRNLNYPQPTPISDCPPPGERKQPDTVIEYLYEQLERLRQNNFRLNEVANELEKVIG